MKGSCRLSVLVLACGVATAWASDPETAFDFTGFKPVMKEAGEARGLVRFFKPEADTVIGQFLPSESEPWAFGSLPWEIVEPYGMNYVERLDRRIATCFAKGTDPEIVKEFMRQERAGFNGRYNAVERWGTQPGTRVSLTWSLVPDGTPTLNRTGTAYVGSSLFSTLNSQFGSTATWIAQVQWAFDRWAYFGGLTYTRVRFNNQEWDDGLAHPDNPGAAGLRGDIRIAMIPIDGGGGILAFNRYPSGGGDMTVDSQDFWAGGASTYTFFRNVLMHEHGHGLGFAHVCPANETKLMEPFATASYLGAQHDDIRAVIRNYNDQNFPNNSIATAKIVTPNVPIGSTLTIGVTANPGVSAGSTLGFAFPTQQDYYRYTVSAPSVVTITARPNGLTYDSSVQNGDGSCASGNNVNSRAIANIAIQVYGAESGNPLYRAVDAVAAGTNESMTNLLVPAGNFFVRVYGSGSTADQSQLYQVDVLGNVALTMTASDNTFDDKVRVTQSAVTNALDYRVHRNTANNFSTASVIATVASPGAVPFVYDDATATPGTTYFYWVTSRQGASEPYRICGGPDQGTRNNPPPNCPADLNNDGIVDFNDYLEFLNLYNLADPAVDFNNDGIVDFNDYLEFLNLYNTPC